MIALLVAYGVLAAARPAEFFIERSIIIAAPATRVFDLIGTLQSWERWNPNGTDDPGIQRSYGAVASGVGATAAWSGKRTGAGRMEITAAAAPHEVIVAVDFEEPFKLRNVNTFRLHADGASTSVTWTMRGPKPLPARIMGLVLNMERMMVRHFDAGLATLKTCAEA